jgi:hypothetical protein
LSNISITNPKYTAIILKSNSTPKAIPYISYSETYTPKMDSTSPKKYISTMAEKFRLADEAGATFEESKPHKFIPIPNWYFFYGSLNDPIKLAQVAGLDKEPQMKEARVKRKTLKYWGLYPVLCDDDNGGTVHGSVWYAPSAEIAQRVHDYETDAYRARAVFAYLKDEKEKLVVITFVWNGAASDLAENY